MEQLSKHAMIVLNSGDKLPIVAMIALITRKRQGHLWPAGFEIRDPKTDAIVFSVGDEVQESIKLDRIIMRPDRSESGDWEGMIPDFTGMGDKTNGERVVVFSQFKGPLKELETRLNEAGISVVRFDGDTPNDIRNQVKRDFDRKHLSEGQEYKWQVVLANYRTGGVGLNFTAATQMIVLDEEWNVGKNEQAYARIDRIGQTEQNSVHILRLSGTVDTWMAELIENKRNMVEGFETNAEMANDMLKRMQNGDMI
jgi:SNF2 family DNA or RNA helicase